MAVPRKLRLGVAERVSIVDFGERCRRCHRSGVRVAIVVDFCVRFCACCGPDSESGLSRGTPEYINHT